MKIRIIDLIHEGLHPAPNGHPENPERIRFALDNLFSSDLNSIIEQPEIDIGKIDISPLFNVHNRQYIENIKKMSESGGGSIDPDTYITNGSYEALMSVVKAAIGSVELILTGKYKNVLIAGRPPGHHADYGQGAGFCLVNNTAIAAQAAVDNYNLGKIAIIDWDVHHGNGTQNIFYNRSDVLYLSLHQFPFYPGTGGKSETGSGKGKGFTINYPMMVGSDEREYLDIFYNNLVPALESYKPEFIIITSGFDGHKNDILGGMNLSSEVYEVLTKLIVDIANRHCDGKVLSFFEGGYDPTANAESLYYHIRGFGGAKREQDEEGA